MKAVILCGGLGTRLRSVLPDLPKPMAPIGGRPFLRYQIDWLKKFNITDLIFCVGYKAEQIKNYFENGKRFGVNITYAEEKELLGTGGAIKNAEKYLDSTFIVLNGDTYAKIDFNQLLEFHQQKKSKYTLSLIKVKNHSRYGSVLIDSENKIFSYTEKPSEKVDSSEIKLNLSENLNVESSNLGYINTGVYVFEPEFFSSLPSGKKVSLEQEVFPQLLSTGIYGYVWEGQFIDIGLPESYQQLQKEIVESAFVPENDTIREAMIKIDQAALGVALIVDKSKKLKGIVTDGDIRRFIIKNEDLNKPIQEAMISNPITAKVGSSLETIHALINPRIKYIPLLNHEDVVQDLFLYSDTFLHAHETLVVRAKAPLRVSFAGGGTDLYSYFKDYGGYVLSSTMDKYCQGTLVKRSDQRITLHSSDLGAFEELSSINQLSYGGKMDLIKAVIKLMEPSYGFDLYLYSDVPPGTGLGSSASIAAVVASLLNHLKEDKLDDYQLSELIYRAERDEIKIAGGWQDQYATVFGGFNFMEFNRQEIIVHPLRLSEEIIEELNSNLFLCYTGKTRESGEIQSRLVKRQDKNSADKDEDVILALSRLKEITLKMRSALLKGKIEEFGELLHESWENKKRLDPQISSSYINQLYDLAIKNGALGGKLLGAGGGGYLLFYCSPLKRKKVTEELTKAGGQVLTFNFDRTGVISWLVRNHQKI